MAGGETLSAAVGLGCRAGATVAAIVARVREARLRAACEIASLNTGAQLRHPALEAAAVQLGLPLIRHDSAALAATAARIVSRSPRVEALFGVGSLAEAAALAGAGEGARLIVTKFSADGVSCAVASR
jgi:cobalt-precorrin 5A hydrolase